MFLNKLLQRNRSFIRCRHPSASSRPNPCQQLCARFRANAHFKGGFSYIERTAHQQDRPLSEMSLEELDSLWDKAKEQ